MFRWRCAEQVREDTGRSECQDNYLEKKKKSKTKMHILLFMGVCVCFCVCVCVSGYECACASTLYWKVEELEPRVLCYSKRQQMTPCKKPLALGKCSLFLWGCSAARVQVGTPVFLCCLGVSFWCWFWCLQGALFPTSSVSSFPRSLQSLLGGLASSTGTSTQQRWEPAVGMCVHCTCTEREGCCWC